MSNPLVILAIILVALILRPPRGKLMYIVVGILGFVVATTTAAAPVQAGLESFTAAFIRGMGG